MQPNEPGTAPLCAVILAAGKGTRMKSDKAKVLHRVFGMPMVCHVVEAVRQAGIGEIVVVTGHQHQQVEDCLATYAVNYAFQDEQLGTGHAVVCAGEMIGAKVKDILILCGDTPLVTPLTLAEMVAAHHGRQAVLTVMTTNRHDPTNYGRIVVDRRDAILKIVEEKDASEAERQIKEVNAGIYLADKEFLFSALEKVGTDNRQGEVYLTDIVAIAANGGLHPGRFVCENSEEILGVNSRLELSEAEKKLQRRFNNELMKQGVTMLDPDTAYVGREVSIGRDSILQAHLHLRGNCKIGEGCAIDSFSVLEDCVLGNGVSIGPFCHLVGQRIADRRIVPANTHHAADGG